MEARQLGRIMSMSISMRLDALAHGMALLAEHVETLMSDLTNLESGNRARSGSAIGIQAEEEAAKVLILLDVARMGWKDQKGCNRQIARYYDHLARGIYAEVAHMRPADLQELRRLVDMYRRSRYLDGPNDVDWIFRNEIYARREESLYVDYVHTEDGGRWVTPAQRDGYGTACRPAAPRLVAALSRSGVLGRPGLEIVTERWREVAVADSTHWSRIAQINAEILEDLDRAGLSAGASPEDRHRLVDEWTFPMHGLDLSVVDVSDDDLKDQRDAWLGAQM